MNANAAIQAVSYTHLYDNLLYVTAGQIIPAVTGVSWDDYIRQHIFAPLGMAYSNTSNADFKPGDDYAFPHERVDGRLQVIPFEVLDNVGPAGAISSCAADMAKWVQLQLCLLYTSRISHRASDCPGRRSPVRDG